MTTAHQHFLHHHTSARLTGAEVTPDIDFKRNVVTYRIVGMKASVEAHIEQLTVGLPINQFWFMGPYRWFDEAEYIAHGEVRLSA